MADETGAEVVSALTATKKNGTGLMLVVRHAFADYSIGDEITDDALVQEILNGEQAIYVIKRAVA